MKTTKIKGGKVTKNELSLNELDLEAIQKLFLHTKSMMISTNDEIRFIKIKTKKGTFIINEIDKELNISMPENQAEELNLINEIMKK